jgi:hypothetical protein
MSANPHAGLKITDDDATIEAMLADLSMPKELEGLVWSSPAVKHSWYKDAHGKIHILSPWRLVGYWAWTREPNLDDFVFRD